MISIGSIIAPMSPSQVDDQLLRQLLGAVGAHLAAAGESASIVIVGGAVLCLRGWVVRTTRDVDVIATTNIDHAKWSPPDFSPALVAAAARVGRDFNVDEDWLNAVIGAQWRTGLPDGIEDDVDWLQFGALSVGLVGRQTLITLKLIAAVDQGPKSVHFQDLVALVPDDSQLELARTWVLAQDASPLFPGMVEEAIRHVRSTR